MKEYIRRYFMLRRHNMKVAIKKAKMSKMCYAFLAPYAIIFALFYILRDCEKKSVNKILL